MTMYVMTTQAASLLQISSRRLRTLLQKGRVVGAYKSGKFWLIPLYEGLPVITKAKR
ncbi:MAG: DNA-binding protein, partial [Xenococcus sp. (in: cyanobacteria)]